jgi:hypothetical protein
MQKSTGNAKLSHLPVKQALKKNLMQKRHISLPAHEFNL